MLQRILAWVLLALTFCTVSSKADIVSVPILNGQFTVNVMTGADAYQLQDIKNNTAAVRHSISDDGNVNVPLNFTFPYFGQNFTNSWMYSNGAVSFKSGNAPGGFCCSGINLPTTRDTGYNYSLLPLQTDLIGQTNNNFYTLGTNTSMTYGWYGVNEYGTGNKSSFEVKIDNAGGVDFRFGQAFITNHPVTIGMTGDLSKGEYYQYYNGNGINRSSFGFTGTFGTGQDPCLADPMANTSCPGYAAAYLSYQCNISALYDSSCPGYATAYFNQQCGISALYNTACPGYAAAYLTQQCNANQLYSTACPGYASAYLTQQCNISQLYSTSCPGYQTAYATKLVLDSQKKTTTTDTSTASTTTTASPDSGSSSGSSTTSSGSTTVASGGTVTDSTSTTAEVKLDLGGATVSATGEIKPSDNIPEVARVTTNAVAVINDTSTSSSQERKPTNVNALSIARSVVAATEAIAKSVASESAKMSYSENSNPSDGIGLNLEGTGIKLSIAGLGMGIQVASFQQENTSNNSTFYSVKNTTGMIAEPVQEFKYTPKQENSNSGTGTEMLPIPQQASSSHFENKNTSVTALQEQRVENNETVKNKGDVSELAGGVDINKMASLPTGYNSYLSFTIKDSPFYDVKEVYKNQVNVDNARALRQMSSDRLHQQLINLQYK